MSKKLNFAIFSSLLPFFYSVYAVIIKDFSILSNSLYTIFCIFGFYFISKKIPALKAGTFLCILIFILLSVFGGKTLNFYSFIPYWDKILHFSSGFIIASACNEVYIYKYPYEKRIKNTFVFLFSVSAAVFWEFFEFSSDKFFKTNSQNNSLSDTMWDMILGSASAFLYVLLKILKEKFFKNC